MRDWFNDHLGFVPSDRVSVLDWLLAPQQLLLEVTDGAVFHDDQGALTTARSRLRWYPDDVWLWLLACQWQRIAQEEAFVGRTAEVGDELGSRIVAAQLARDLIRLCFLIERRYAPYSKWLGTAFSRLEAGHEVGAALQAALNARDHGEREAGLTVAYEAAARRHNALDITDPVDPSTRPFHARPFQVLHADRFVAACQERLSDPELRGLPLVGAVDQIVDSTDVLSHAERARKLRGLLIKA